MTSAISILTESYYSPDNPAIFIANPVLAKWNNCQFTGRESFEDVQDTLFGFNVTVGEYLQLILLIPRMDHFLRILMQQGYSVYIIALNMSLTSFSKFNKDNYWTNQIDLLEYGSSKHSWFVGCRRCRANLSNVESSEDHCNTCTYAQLYNEVLPGSKMLDISVTAQQVVSMFDAALGVVNSGKMGGALPPPREKYLTQEEDGYMLCQFLNEEEDDEPFFKWLSLYDTIEVSTSSISLICMLFHNYFYNFSISLLPMSFYCVVLYWQRAAFGGPQRRDFLPLPFLCNLCSKSCY